MRIASGLFAGLFGLGAIVQWNDPDPALWIVAYLAGTGLALLGAAGRPARVGSALAAVVFAGWFLLLAPSLRGAPHEAFTSFEMQATSHEEPREAVGLGLLAAWNAALAAWAHRLRVRPVGPRSPTGDSEAAR